MARADEDRKRVHAGRARGSPAKRQQQYVRAQYEDLDRRHRRQRQAGLRRETNAQPREGHEWVWMQNGAPWCVVADRLAHTCPVCNGTRPGRGEAGSRRAGAGAGANPRAPVTTAPAPATAAGAGAGEAGGDGRAAAPLGDTQQALAALFDEVAAGDGGGGDGEGGGIGEAEAGDTEAAENQAAAGGDNGADVADDTMFTHRQAWVHERVEVRARLARGA